MKFALITTLMLLSFFFSLAQTDINGKVYSSEGGRTSPIPFCNVVFYSTSDSTKIAYASVTDLNGNYSLDKVTARSYIAIISSIGYRPYRSLIEVPEKGKFTFDIAMKEEDIFLEAIEVKANRVQRSFDKSTYMITALEISKARSSFDLLENIPSLNIDNLNKTVAAANGGLVKILINGLNATEKELLTLKPEDIQKVEHFDLPPARYAAYASVVNVITKKIEDGGVAGFDMQHAFSTGFANDMAFFRYNKGKNQISFSYSLNYRDYKKRQLNETYRYAFNSSNYYRDLNANSHFGYKENYFDIGFINQKDSSYAVQVKISPNINIRYSNDNSVVSSQIDGVQSNRVGNKTTDENTLNPIFDAYFWKQLRNKQEIVFNIVGTGYFSNYKLKNIEQKPSMDTALFDQMKSSNEKMSLIGEFIYSKQVGSVKINIGYRHVQGQMASRVENSFENPTYRINNSQDYGYGEIRGVKGKYTYRGSIGLTHSSYKENFSNNTYNHWLFRPLALVGYSINESTGVKAYYMSNAIEPMLTELSNNKVVITDNVVYQGNPNLHPYRGHVGGLAYYYYSQKINIELEAKYAYAKGYINTYFINTPYYIARTSVNANWTNSLIFKYSGVFKPLKQEWLQLKINGGIIDSRVNSSEVGQISNLCYPLSGSVQVVISHMFVLSYQNTLVVKELDGPYLKSNENYSSIGVSFKGGPISASINMFWPFTKAKYSIETISESIVQYKSQSSINDNASMITVGLTYNFQFGKKYKPQSKILNNADKDSGVFK